MNILQMPLGTEWRDDWDAFDEYIRQHVNRVLAEMMVEKLRPFDEEFERRIIEEHPNPEGAYDESE